MLEEDIIMTLLENLLTLYKYLITALEMMLMKELTMEYMMTHLMTKISNRKEKEPQGEDTTMVSLQIKAGYIPLWQGMRMCFYCGKLNHTR